MQLLLISQNNLTINLFISAGPPDCSGLIKLITNTCRKQTGIIFVKLEFQLILQLQETEIVALFLNFGLQIYIRS